VVIAQSYKLALTPSFLFSPTARFLLMLSLGWSGFLTTPYSFDNFTVAEGAVIEVSVTAENSTSESGKAALNNFSRGINETYILYGNATENGTICGGSAEWVVEHNEDWGVFIGNFSSVAFQGCKATTVTCSEVSLSNSTLFSLVHKLPPRGKT
jgi:hypothetical protein